MSKKIMAVKNHNTSLLKRAHNKVTHTPQGSMKGSTTTLPTKKVSNTLILLKEKLTPIFIKLNQIKASVTLKEPETISSSPTVVNAFDAWVKKKNEQMKKLKIKEAKEKERLSQMKNKTKILEEFTTWSAYLEEKESKAKEYEMKKHNTVKQPTKVRLVTKGEKSDKLRTTKSLTSWYEIKKISGKKQQIEPLRLGRVNGHTAKEPPKLTKYVIKPDPAFQARYRYVLDEARSRPSEVILNCKESDNDDDPARLPPVYRALLKNENVQTNNKLK